MSENYYMPPKKICFGFTVCYSKVNIWPSYREDQFPVPAYYPELKYL